MTAFMDMALREARLAGERGEVPVGCVLVCDGKVIARAGNRTLAERDPTAHAEIVAIRHAARLLGSERLDDCDLYAMGFDPVMTAPERRAHNTPHPDLSAVEHHVARLRAAEAVVLCFPVWWYGMPAILKGYFDRVWINGVAFHLGNPFHHV